MTARATTRRTWTGGRKRIPDVPAEPKRSGRKDTRRWCRGRVGIEHAYAWADDARFDYDGKRQGLPRVLACVACGRRKDWCWNATTDCHCGAHKATHEHAKLPTPTKATCERNTEKRKAPGDAPVDVRAGGGMDNSLNEVEP